MSHPETRGTAEPAAAPNPAPAGHRAAAHKGSRLGTLASLGLFAAIGAGGWYLAKAYPEQAAKLWASATGARSGHEPAAHAEAPPPLAKLVDGLIELDDKAVEAIGVQTAQVLAQTKPMHLELLGTTNYDEHTRSQVRPLFKGRVDSVRTEVGRTVKKGEPLVDLYSTVLAEAKNAYEIEHIQWVYDENLVKNREELFKTKAVSERLLLETRNSEMKSKREAEVARDKLLVYGLTDEEIQDLHKESGAQKARMTLRAPADGIVIERNVVPGNLYDENDTLLVIAPLDHLWVWGNVFESDLDLISLGQAWEIRFPFLNQVLRGQVEYISNRVDPVTHSVRIRTSVPNLDGKLKSNMLVRGMLEIPPLPSRTVIPRTALITDDGHYFVFLRSEVGGKARFERRALTVAHEKDDEVIVEYGLRPGESVVRVGGLILAQLYEELHSAGGDVPRAPTPVARR